MIKLLNKINVQLWVYGNMPQQYIDFCKINIVNVVQVKHTVWHLDQIKKVMDVS